MLKRIVKMLGLLIFLTSCSQSLMYSPMNKHRLSGNYLLKKFNYNLSNNSVSKNNQLKVKTDKEESFTEIEKDIDVYFTEGLSAELNVSGLMYDWQSTKIITGSIEKLLVDKSNEKLSVEITVVYKITENGKEIDKYQNKIVKKLRDGITIGKEDYNGILQETVKLSIDDYCKRLSDKKFLSEVK